MSKQTGYSYDIQSGAIERKRKLAEMLMGAQGPQGTQMAGGMAVKQGPLEFLAPLAGQFAGAKLNDKADDAETQLQTDRNAKLGEWLKGMPGTDPVQPVMPTTGFSTAAGQQSFADATQASNEAAQREKLAWALQGQQMGPTGQAVSGALLQSSLATPEIKYQDLGDRIGVFQNGVQTGSIAKGVSADTRFKDDTTRRGQDIGALTTARGQDITQRGQDLSATTAMRGQDIGAQTAAAGRDTTERGQDMTAEAAKAKAAAGVGAKMPVLKSLEYTLGRFAEQNEQVETGGPGGLRGSLSKVLDYQDAAALDNLSQQVSTELRTIFRIPGEGSLSDKEQAQYGLQLPSRSFSPKQNKQIMLDLENRARLRMGLEPLPAFRGAGASGSWDDAGGADPELDALLNKYAPQ